MPALQPGLTVRAEVPADAPDGPPGGTTCDGAAISTQRPDAWRCNTVDPCFAPSALGGDVVACATDPWSDSVLLMHLASPITPDTNQCPTGAQPCVRNRLPFDFTTLPWALELTNGARCTLKARGTLVEIGGVLLSWLCETADGMGAAAGGSPASTVRNAVDRSAPLWTVFYLGPSSHALEEVGVLVAWY